MPKFKVTVRQWVEELAVMEFKADSKIDAKNQADDYHLTDDDWDWRDGNDVQDFEIVSVKEVKE